MPHTRELRRRLEAACPSRRRTPCCHRDLQGKPAATNTCGTSDAWQKQEEAKRNNYLFCLLDTQLSFGLLKEFKSVQTLLSKTSDSAFIPNLVPFGLRMFPDVFKTVVLLWRHPTMSLFSPKSAFPKILDMDIFRRVFIQSSILGSLSWRDIS